MKAHHPATIEDLLKTPEDGQKYELVDGEIVVSPGGGQHSKVGFRIGFLLLQVLEKEPDGDIYGPDVGIVLPNGDIRSPDVCFVRQKKLPGGKTPETFVEVVPDLVVEVLSPTDRMRQVADKIGEFLEFGVPIVWLVDPKAKTVTVYRSLSDTEQLTEQDVITASPVLPAFSVQVSEFFR